MTTLTLRTAVAPAPAIPEQPSRSRRLSAAGTRSIPRSMPLDRRERVARLLSLAELESDSTSSGA